jgi:uncharacterized protein (DUF433 family)
LVEVNPEIQSGVPVLAGTRLPVSAIVDNAEYGLSVAEISEQFEVSEAQVEAILGYAKGHRIAGTFDRNCCAPAATSAKG